MLAAALRQDLTAAIATSVVAAFQRARPEAEPYRHWLVSEIFPAGVTDALRALPMTPPDLDGLSGKRELHNDQRCYFDAGNIGRFEICAAVAEAFQSSAVAGTIEQTTGARIEGSFVRLEYAQDVEGFWLEPHTDLGVKRFTMLLYLPDSPDQVDLGTDVYSDPTTWAKRPPFIDNTALVFVPGADTWHGMSRRAIPGVRRSLIMNYVTDEWRDREQLAYPRTPVRV